MKLERGGKLVYDFDIRVWRTTFVKRERVWGGVKTEVPLLCLDKLRAKTGDGKNWA